MWAYDTELGGAPAHAPLRFTATYDGGEDSFAGLAMGVHDPNTGNWFNPYTYTLHVDWGDGTDETIVVPVGAMDPSTAPMHTYAAGTYTTSITFVDMLRVYKPELMLASGGTAFSLASFGTAPAFVGVRLSVWNGFDSVPDLPEWILSTAGMFNNLSIIPDITGWDTGSVVDMSYMFNNAPAFNQDIGGWDTSSVVDMSAMFSVAQAFNQDIGGWDTSSVVDMSVMFNYAGAFNQDIGGWDTGSVVDMAFMFDSATTFNQDIGGWDTGSVVDMSYMFNNAPAFNQDIGGWDTSSVVDMSAMFSVAQAFNQDLSGWCVEQIASKPNQFDHSANAWNKTGRQPKWGEGCKTCPDGSQHHTDYTCP